MALLAVPVAIIGDISNGLLADIAKVSEKRVGTDATAMFFAGRTFLQKVSQTIGLVFFAILTALGRDPLDDLGIRLSGPVAIGMYLVAIVAFRRFDEVDLSTKLGNVDASRACLISNTATRADAVEVFWVLRIVFFNRIRSDQPSHPPRFGKLDHRRTFPK